MREPVTVQFSPSIYRVNESDGEVDITVTLSESLSSAAEMQLSGYRREVKTVTIPANSTSHTTSLTVTANPGVGPTEATYTLRLGTSDVRLSVNTATATLTVVDDTEATVDFQQNIYRVEEGTRNLTVVLEVTNPQVRCPVWVTFNVYFSYSDPDGVFASVPTSPVQFIECNVQRAIRFDLNNDSVVEETSEATLVLDRVTSDSPGVASRVQFGPNSPATVEVFDSRDTALVGFEHPSYSVTEGNSVELCAVLREGDSVAFPFTVSLEYADPDGALSSGGPTSFTFGALNPKSCVEFQTHDDDVSTEASFVTFRMTRPSDLDPRIRISRSAATLRVNDDDPPSGTVRVTVASNPSGRTVTVDGTNRSAPYTATWNSGSSHTLDVPSPQRVSGGRYVFSSWSHGGPKSQTVSPTGDTTYTANFTFRADTTNRAPTVTPSSPTYQLLSEPTGMSLTFAARATDPDNNLSSYEWFVNDVSIYSGPLPLTGDVTVRSLPIQFVKPGSHKVKITFTDSTGLSDSVTWDVEAKGPDLRTCPGESGSAQRGSAPYGGAMVNLSLTGVSPVRGAPEPEVHLC